MDVPEGTMMGHYRILEQLGAGGMGQVYVAEDTKLERRVALKVLPHQLACDPKLLQCFTDEAQTLLAIAAPRRDESGQSPADSDTERRRSAQRLFIHEARVTGQLEHPNIVPVHDIGVDRQGRLFFIMKVVVGKNLGQIIRELPKGPIEHHQLLELIEVVIKVCHALAFAHARGIVHCDVKPSNVMVGEFGQVYLVDWGVARLVRDQVLTGSVEQAPGTRSDWTLPLLGTPSHMSPEQAQGEKAAINERSDVFLVGALLYQILARRPPYRRATLMATLLEAASGRFIPPEKVVGDAAVPPALGRIVMRAMARDPAERYQSIVELQEALIQLSRGGGQFPRINIPVGVDIVCEGEEGDAAYFIVSGRCRVAVGSADTYRVLRELGPGDAFGETAILSPGPRTATVTTVEPTTVEVVTRDAFDHELSSIKPWMALFIHTLADRFRERVG